jgi:PKD repeat protein
MKKIQVIIIITILILTGFLCGCNEENNTNNNNNTTNGNNGINLKPIAYASANPTSGSAPLTVRFSSEGSYDPDGEIITYKWDLGLGSRVDNNPNPIHTYMEPGNYTVRLYVGDNNNTFSNESSIIIIVY